MTAKGQEPAQRVEVTAEVDRHDAEALRLEVHRLARRLGLEIQDVKTD